MTALSRAHLREAANLMEQLAAKDDALSPDERRMVERHIACESEHTSTPLCGCSFDHLTLLIDRLAPKPESTK